MSGKNDMFVLSREKGISDIDESKQLKIVS